jgi:hypothetical protein
MSAMTPQMDAALSADKPLIFGAVQIDFPEYSLRLIDGAGEVTIGGNLFKGRDDIFGTLGAISEIDDAMDDQAPAISVALIPPKASTAAELASPLFQGSRIRLWLGAIVRDTGEVIADPYLLFDGEIDQPTFAAGAKVREVEYECVSAMERLFDDDEGFRLNNASHQRVWPGEEGLEHVTALTKQIYWGVAKPGMSSGGGSGGGFGNGSRYDNQFVRIR